MGCSVGQGTCDGGDSIILKRVSRRGEHEKITYSLVRYLLCQT